MASPARKTPAKTKLSARRQAAGLSQVELAEKTGLALRTVQRIDQGRMSNPPVRYLSNLALALGCELEEICEDEWLGWTVFDERASRPGEP